jgi:hypothetical protein
MLSLADEPKADAVALPLITQKRTRTRVAIIDPRAVGSFGALIKI